MQVVKTTYSNFGASINGLYLVCHVVDSTTVAVAVLMSNALMSTAYYAWPLRVHLAVLGP